MSNTVGPTSNVASWLSRAKEQAASTIREAQAFAEALQMLRQEQGAPFAADFKLALAHTKAMSAKEDLISASKLLAQLS